MGICIKSLGERGKLDGASGAGEESSPRCTWPRLQLSTRHPSTLRAFPHSAPLRTVSLCWFPMAALASCHKRSSLNGHTCIPFQARRPEVYTGLTRLPPWCSLCSCLFQLPEAPTLAHGPFLGLPSLQYGIFQPLPDPPASLMRTLVMLWGSLG